MDSLDELPLSQGSGGFAHCRADSSDADETGSSGVVVALAPPLIAHADVVGALMPLPGASVCVDDSVAQESKGAIAAIRLRAPPPKRPRGRPPKPQPLVDHGATATLASAGATPQEACLLAPFTLSVRTSGALPTPESAVARAAVVPEAVLQALSAGPVVVQGFVVVPSELTDAIEAASAFGRDRLGDVSAATKAVAGELLGREWSFTTSRVMARSLMLRPQRLTTETGRIAAFLFWYHRCRQHALDEAVVTKLPRSALVGYFEFASHDETPLDVRVARDPSERRLLTTAPAVGEGPAQEGARIGSLGAICRLGSSPALTLSSSATSQKLVQTVLTSAMLVNVNGEHIGVFSRAPCPVGIVSSTTIRSLLGLQFRMSPATRAAKLYPLQHRIACTDAHASNFRCESGIAAARGPPQQSVGLHKVCEAHRASLIHKKVFCLLEADVRGMIHCALSLRNGSAMQRLRSCLRSEVESRLELLVGGRPSAAAVGYKTQAIRLFVTHGARAVVRRVLLTLCPNGDWRSDRIQFYCNLGRVPISDATDAIDHVSGGLLVALCGTQPSVYPRHRWVGADLACDDLGIFECCHRLLSTVYLRFASSFVRGSMQRHLLALVAIAAKQDASGVFQHRVDGSAEVGRDGAATVGDAVDDDGLGGDAERATRLARDEVGSRDWATQNARSRSIARSFVASQPLCRLVVMRNVLEPLRVYVRSQFFRAGVDFERGEQAKLAGRLSRGEFGVGLRTYRALEMAKGHDDLRLFSQVRLLFESPELWGIIPRHRQTVHERALCFRLLSRLGCGVEQLLASEHRRCPWQLFRLLEDVSFTGQLLDAAPCMYDPWTRRVMERYPLLTEHGLLCTLELVALHLQVDTCAVESKHATVRRLLKFASLQTWPTTLDLLSARWLLLQSRREAMRLRTPRYARATRTQPPLQARGVRKHGKRGRNVGGSWKAFVSIAYLGSRGRKPDFRTIAEEYRAAKRSNSALYTQAVRIGREAQRVAWAMGRPARRLSSLRSVPRSRLRTPFQLLRDALWAATHTLDTGSQAIACSSLTLASGASVADALSLARYLKHKSDESARAVVARQEELMDAWRRDETQRLHTRFADARFLGDVRGFSLVPSALCTMLEALPPSREEVESAVGWASSHPLVSNLGQTLDAAWAGLHGACLDANSAIGDPPQAEIESPCCTAGICLCTRAGKALARLASAVLGAMKRRCVDSDAVRKLVNGYVVICVVGRPVPLDAVADPDELPLDDVERSRSLWVHIGMHYLSPYRPTFMLLDRSEPLPEVHEDPRRIFVRTQSRFQTLHLALSGFEAFDQVWASWYQVEEADRPTLGFAPHTVPLVPFGADGESLIWSADPKVGRVLGGLARADRSGVRREGDGEPLDAAPSLAAIDDLAMDDVRTSAEELLALYEFGGATDVRPESLSEGFPPPLGGSAVGAAASSSSSSAVVGVAMPPPPPPSATGSGRGERRRKGPPLASVLVRGGRISYYENGNFQAECDTASHGACILTRVGRKGKLHNKGRPLGLLTHWLACGPLCETREQHWSEEVLRPDYERRKFFREELAEVDGSAVLFAYERAWALDSGESWEPLDQS